MLQRGAVLLALLVALAPVACGGDDDDTGSESGSGSGSGDFSAGYSAEDESEPALEPTAEECGGKAPIDVEPPAAYDGFVRLCKPEFADNLLVVWNISNTVI